MVIVPKFNALKAFFFSLLLLGCDPDRSVRGRVVPLEDLDQIQKGVGVLNKTDVERLIGPASSVLSFDPCTWYYFNLFTETSAFFSPSIKENKGFALLFSSDGKLVKYIPNSGTKSLEIALKETALPSTHRKEFLKELFRNAGRFGKKAKENCKKP
ncbi:MULTISPECIES: outer membrane protein assembly factor BamE domain-containing protein [Holospora]|uniref:SmpA / OmlA family protein n=2 Tax=Holospora TaxID=44747 RepID=A0A061JGE6_9PROT|nr:MULTISPECIES: outer membrane protein assembly factor BamE [Holospora]ETZ05106.1 SmpA / OmlA family protein [Holospora undulata HU1]GAJ46209.1 SmpA / OmlA family protein [Holospora elegans E1]